MFKKTFTRLLVLGSLAFGFFFAVVAFDKARKSALQDPESEVKAGTYHPTGEFVLESIVGSVLIGIK